ncbi:MAG TPA: hypothetical protein VGM33_06840 [Baekduia sp.]|jgi:uncharacterized membrane protein
MSNLSRRSGSGLSRSARERRAFQLAMVGGTASVVAVVAFFLAVFGAIGWTLFVLAVIVAALSGVMFRRQVGK